jgi:hypothetical protein
MIPQSLVDELLRAVDIIFSVPPPKLASIKYMIDPQTGSVVPAAAMLLGATGAIALHGNELAQVRLLELTDGKQILPTDPIDVELSILRLVTRRDDGFTVACRPEAEFAIDLLLAERDLCNTGGRVVQLTHEEGKIQ